MALSTVITVLVALLSAHAPAVQGATARSSVRLVVSGSGSAQGTAKSTASNGGVATSKVDGQSKGGDVELAASSKAVNGQTAEAIAKGTAENGKKAEAIATAIGSAEGKVRAEAIAEAAKEGEGNAIAIAVGKAVQNGKRKEAVSAIVDARAVAVNRGAGTAFARAVGVGIADRGDAAQAYVEAISILLEADGCEKFKPTLVEAKAQAVADGKERPFVDELESKVQVTECLIPSCDGDRKQCCSESGEKCLCGDNGCPYTLWKATPKKMWGCNKDCNGNSDICICN